MLCLSCFRLFCLFEFHGFRSHLIYLIAVKRRITAAGAWGEGVVPSVLRPDSLCPEQLSLRRISFRPVSGTALPRTLIRLSGRGYKWR